MLNFSQTYFSKNILWEHSYDGLFSGLPLNQLRSHSIFKLILFWHFLSFDSAIIFFKISLFRVINGKQQKSSGIMNYKAFHQRSSLESEERIF